MPRLHDLHKPDLLAVPIATLLRDAIFDWELRPGDRIVERQLASQWNVSRAPLREAIEQLTAEGLLVRSPHRGASVREVSEKELTELFAVREMIEVTAAQAAIRLASDADISELAVTVEATKQSSGEQDLREYSRQGLAFHDQLVRLSKNATLIEIYDGVKLRFRRYQFLFAALPNLPRSSAAEHEIIFCAIQRRDGDLAARSIRDHLAHLISRFSECERFPTTLNGRPSIINHPAEATRP